MLFQLMLGVILVLVGGIGLLFPPKKINYIYGYRTKRSMRSDEAWQYANRYSSQLMTAFGALTIGIGLGCQLMSWSFWIPVAIGLLLILALIALTERRLKNKFGHD